MIDKTMAKPPRTLCCVEGPEFGSSPMPKILDWDTDWPPGEPPRMWINFTEGTRYICPTCTEVYVATWVPDRIQGSVMTCAHWEWRVETFWQQAKRIWHGMRNR